MRLKGDAEEFEFKNNDKVVMSRESLEFKENNWRLMYGCISVKKR